MIQRIQDLEQNYIRTRYALGRPSGMMAMERSNGEKRTTWFHPNSRSDKLTKRVENFEFAVEVSI